MLIETPLNLWLFGLRCAISPLLLQVFEDENEAVRYCDLLQGGGKGCEGVAEIEASSVRVPSKLFTHQLSLWNVDL